MHLQCRSRITSISGTARHLATIAQPGGDAVYSKMDTCDDPFVRIPCAIPLQQFYLDMVERVDIGKSITNGTLERRGALKQRALAKNSKYRSDRRLPLLVYPPKDHLA